MSDQVVVFPDAATITIAYLSAELARRTHPASVHGHVPNPRPDSFVTVAVGGGARATRVSDAPTLLVESWDVDDETALATAQLCRGLIFAMRGTSQSGVAVYRIEEAAGPQALPDPVSNQPRYVFTIAVGLRGAAL